MSIDLRKALFLFLMGFAGCLLIGFLFVGNRIFDSRQPSFQFISYGFLLAALYVTRRQFPRRYYVPVALLFTILRVVMTAQTQLAAIAGQLMIVCVTALGVEIYIRWYADLLAPLRFGRFLALAGAVAAANLVISLPAAAVLDLPDPRTYIEAQTFFGFLFGAGLGMGVEVAEWLIRAADGRKRGLSYG